MFEQKNLASTPYSGKKAAAASQLDRERDYWLKKLSGQLAIAYLGTYLHRRGIGFDYVNSFQAEKDRLREKLEKNNILVIAIVTTFYVSVFPILEIMNFLRTCGHTARIIVGGPFIANQVRTQDEKGLRYLFETIGADFYVNSSQGEAALVKIIQALENNLPFHQIDNIYYKNGGAGENRYQATAIQNRFSKGKPPGRGGKPFSVSSPGFDSLV
jgi:hypothetical protein